MTSVRLRAWSPGDASAIAPVLDDPQVLRWSHIGELGAERWIAEQSEGRRGPSMAVCEADDDRVLGKVALRLPGKASPATSCAVIWADDRPVGELSYWAGRRDTSTANASPARPTWSSSYSRCVHHHPLSAGGRGSAAGARPVSVLATGSAAAAPVAAHRDRPRAGAIVGRHARGPRTRPYGAGDVEASSARIRGRVQPVRAGGHASEFLAATRVPR